MKQIKLTELPEILTNEILEVLYQMAEEQTPEWKEFYRNQITDTQYRQYSDFKRTRQEQEAAVREKQMTQEEQDAYHLSVLKWGATRWNDGNFDLFYQHKEMEALRKEEQQAYWGNASIPWDIQTRLDYMKSGEKYYHFSACSHPFSTFYKTSFEIGGVFFHSVVQYVAFRKAELFRDRNIIQKIMATTTPLQAFRLSQNVKNYDKAVWRNMYMGNHLLDANKAKILQDDKVKKCLFDTQGQTIVLTNKEDKVWGTGCNMGSPLLQNRDNWPGMNLLGELLTNIRIELMGYY